MHTETEGRVIVTDSGFGPEDFDGAFAGTETIAANGPLRAVHLASHEDPTVLDARLGDVEIIRIDFPSFADGRGFTIARQLRRMGFGGRLRAAGHVLADQYAMARRSGFDEIEISADLARRQPEDQWLARAGWQEHDYRSRLGAAAFS